MTDEEHKIRERIRAGKTITPRQAQILLRERDFTMQIGLGFFNSLTTLRAFMSEDAPQWAKEKVKLDTDKNQAALESCQKLMFEISKGVIA